MAAVAARAVTAEKRTPACQSATSGSYSAACVRTRRRSAARFPKAIRILILIAGLALPFGYINAYANLAVTGYNRDSLMEQCRQERIHNERLKVELIRRSSPRSIVALAQKQGMIYATQYDYLQKPKAVASAKRSD